MKIEIANTIPLPEILVKIGLTPVCKADHRFFYLSPFYEAKEAKLVIDTESNTWHDHELDRYGDVVTFVCFYLKTQCVDHDEEHALRWLDAMFGNHKLIDAILIKDYSHENDRYSVEKTETITYPALIRYIEGRGIPLHIASEYLQQVQFYCDRTKRTYTALGFRNEDKGYELRNPYFKGASNPQAITFIRGLVPKHGGFHVFQSIFDYLSVITQRNNRKFNDDTIIMNSLGNMRDAAAYIHKYGYERAYLWLNNDTAGRQATEAFGKFFAKEPGLKTVPMNYKYPRYKDVNAAHVARLGLTTSLLPDNSNVRGDA